jgi:erythromycin esterase-like protein
LTTADLRDPADLDPLLDRIGDARWVLVGEASHGTHEYYAWRAELTKRLVAERGFSFVGVEGDWPDCQAVHRSVTLAADGAADPYDALDRYERWPTWMWANDEVAGFARWLRACNATRPPERRAGFHGIDVYSLWDSLRAVVGYLVEREPAHVATAMEAWRCFEPYAEDPQRYARAQRLVPASCENAVVELLCRLRGSGTASADRFEAEQNAAVVAGAETYYRTMVRGGPESWNVRDTHMADTLDRLMAFYGPDAKAVVWEHNTHIGDARATDMAAAGMVNVGQLVRERHGAEGVVLVGFGGYAGEVIAADAWGAPAERLPVPEARAGSVERLLHDERGRDTLFVFPPERAQPDWLRLPLDHRAIGVVYHPGRERWGNYVPTVLGARYDAFLYLETTRALRPMHGEPAYPRELETFPSGR